jgi:predicted metal-binding integral membrane protein DUF2182
LYRVSSLRDISVRHPEWWMLALSVCAWIALCLRPMSHTTVGLDWLLMALAMIGPLVPGPMRTTAERSLWRRRHRAIAGFAAGYVTQWVLAGVPLLALDLLLGPDRHGALLVGAVGLAAAAAWQSTPLKRRAVFACHARASLAPTGWRADADCVRYGRTIGSSCIQSCWPMMLAGWLLGHPFGAMLGATAMSAFERSSPRSGPRTVGVVLAALAAGCAVLGLWSVA